MFLPENKHTDGFIKKIVILIIIIVCAISLLAVWHFTWDQPHVPSQHSNSLPKSRLTAKLEAMSLRDKVANLFVFHTPGTDENAMKAFVEKYHPGGMILMGDNIPTSDENLRRIAAAIRGSDDTYPRLVAIDEEGGSVTRLAKDVFLSGETLKNQDSLATRSAFKERSELLQSVGITLNFGIIADVTDDPNSFIYDRALGTTPKIASDNVRAAVDGARGLTLSTLKHFPGHGETSADSHTSIPTANLEYNAWLKKDALPFKAGIDNGAEVVMMGHLRYNSVDFAPATLSLKWHDILRKQLAFKGVIITDDMCMLQASGDPLYTDPITNAVSALKAGNTLLLYVLDNSGSQTTRIDPDSLIDGVVNAVNTGKIKQSTIEDYTRQVLQLRERSSGFVQNK